MAHGLMFTADSIVHMCSVGPHINLCSVNSIQTYDVALCKPKKCQVMSFVFQLFQVLLLLHVLCTRFSYKLCLQQVQYNAKNSTSTAVVVFAI